LPQGIAAEPESLARFEREAKLLAALDHPNIAAVYGLHEAEGQRFIAMEFVPGEDLAQRLARGPLPAEDALDIGRQVAAALEAAHDQGVIHRDLKPANITCTPEGKVKVLDLGLAKALVAEASGDSPSLSLSPTLTSAGTIAGTLLGTAAYMSPEQAKGRTVDRRADIWAFGVVLHEMLTGRKMFEAETISETLAAVLRDEVKIDALPAGVPASVATLLGRCLDRNPRTRLRDIGEARIALSTEALSAAESPAAGESGVAAAAVASSPVSRFLPWVLMALAAVVAAFALWRASSGPVDVAGELITLVAPIAADLQMPLVENGLLALSPDGKTLALVLANDQKKRMLYVRRLDRDELVEIPGTENALTPFFSPDGAWIAFFADDQLKKVSTGGGTPMPLCDARGGNRGGAWGTDDVITFSPHFTEPLMRVSGTGGEPMPFTSIDSVNGERTHRWPDAVAGEDLVLFTVGTIDSPAGYDEARIDAIRPSTGERRTVLERASMAKYVPTGHLLFGRGGFLFAVPFDAGSLETRGNPVPVVENVMGNSASGVVHADVARNGVLAFVSGTRISAHSRLVWRTRDGAKDPLGVPTANYLQPSLSPDRKRIAITIRSEDSIDDIWTHQIGQDTLTRWTFEGQSRAPLWSPDGRRIAFASARGNALTSVYVKAADGSGPAEKLYGPEQLQIEGAANLRPRSWTDGEHLIVQYADENSQNIGSFSENGEPRLLVSTPATEVQPQLSPNGRWLAYISNETGDRRVFVRAFPGPGGKWQVSNTSGGWPIWSPDGTELFYRWQTNLYSVPVDESSGSFESGRPEIVFDDLDLVESYDYDVFDANRFLLVEIVGSGTGPAGVTVVVNWFDELERLVPD
jgi:serine/threonine-protein kinase